VASHLAMDKVLAVEQLHAAGRSWLEIARTFGIDGKTVAPILHENRKIVGGLAPPCRSKLTVQSKRTERSELVCPFGGGRLGPAEHPVEHFTLRVANDR
jgi:hypothetical protein